MARYDLFKKLIEQLGLVLAKLIFNLKNDLAQGDIEESLESVNTVFQEEFERDFLEIENLSEEEFVELLKSNKKLNTENLEHLAELFYLIGKSNENKKLLKKSKTIIEYILNSTKTFSFQHQQKIQEIEGLISNNNF
jgi:hypothetical protein